MVMLTCAASGGYTFVDRALYLPEPWTGDRDRCRAAGVPDEVGFATKPQLGLRMLERALAAGLPFAWVAADSGYGRDPGAAGLAARRPTGAFLLEGPRC
jgi:SRSO17 transposase